MILINGKEIYVDHTSVSKDMPVLVLSPALGSSIELEDRLQFPDWNISSKSQSVLRYDYPGHGRSAPENAYQRLTWEKLGENLCEILSELRLNQVVLAGCSMGAAVSIYAAIIAKQYDIKVRGLVLMAPPIFGDERKKIAQTYLDWADLVRREGNSALVSKWRAAKPTEFFRREFPEARDLYFADFLLRDPISMAAAFEASALSDLPHPNSLKALSCPVRVLARVDDPLHPVQTAQTLTAYLPNVILSIACDGPAVRAWPEMINNFIETIVLSTTRT